MAPRTIHDEREKAKKLSPLLVTTKLPEEWTDVKVEYERADGSIGKEYLPTHQAESAEHMLYCLDEFNNAATEHNWVGNTRFVKYRKTLRGAARTKFDAARASNPGNNVAVFRTCIRTMIASIVGNQSHSNFVSYMQVVKKPTGMTVPEFVERMLLLCRYSIYLLRVPHCSRWSCSRILLPQTQSRSTKLYHD